MVLHHTVRVGQLAKFVHCVGVHVGVEQVFFTCFLGGLLTIYQGGCVLRGRLSLLSFEQIGAHGVQGVTITVGGLGVVFFVGCTIWGFGFMNSILVYFNRNRWAPFGDFTTKEVPSGFLAVCCVIVVTRGW